MGKRLYFIDALRGLAILLMLEGHFIDTLLGASFRDPDHVVYSSWAYVRGNTAPLFFTIAGLIFAYLILIAPTRKDFTLRLKKGFRRGVQLVLIGYLLRFSFYGLLEGRLRPYTIAVDVLHVMGAGIIVLSLFMWLTKRRLSLVLFSSILIFLITFFIDPITRAMTLENTHPLLANWLVKSNGSVFVLFPWIGYLFAGSSVACLLQLVQGSLKKKLILCGSLIFVGLVMIFNSSSVLSQMGHYYGLELLHGIANFNWLFPRLGGVLILISSVFLLENWLQFKWLSKVGKHTLGIYVVHFIILYGSFTGVGLYHIYGKSLTVFEVFISLIPFMVVSTILGSLNYTTILNRIVQPLISLKNNRFNHV